MSLSVVPFDEATHTAHVVAATAERHREEDEQRNPKAIVGLDALLAHHRCSYLNSPLFKAILVIPAVGNMAWYIVNSLISGMILDTHMSSRKGKEENSQDLLRLSNQYSWLAIVGNLVAIGGIAALLLTRGVANLPVSNVRLIYTTFGVLALFVIYLIFNILRNHKAIQEYQEQV